MGGLKHGAAPWGHDGVLARFLKFGEGYGAAKMISQCYYRWPILGFCTENVVLEMLVFTTFLAEAITLFQ